MRSLDLRDRDRLSPSAPQPRAPLPLRVLLILGVAASSLIEPAAAGDRIGRGANPYGIEWRGTIATPARDRASLAAYPPASSSAPRPVPFASAPAPRAKTYPPAPTPPLPACGVFTDCSFEAGGVGWTGADLSSPLLALGVYPAGVSTGFGIFTSAPTDGGVAVLTGWDGNGPGDILAWQEVVLQPAAARLGFDYRAGWDMFNFAGSTMDREFRVEIQPPGGGPPLQSTTILVANAGTVNLDTGNLVGVVDVSPFAGQLVRVVFRWWVPESFTGPGMFQLDRIAVVENDCVAIDNCSFETGGFPSWVATDLSTPFFPMSVVGAGISVMPGAFLTLPTHGVLTHVHGFDGNGPGDIVLHQDVNLPAGTFSLDFDYRAAWDLLNYGATLPREFFVEVQPFGGGPVLQSTSILRALPGTLVLDTGPRKGLVDISKFAGAPHRIVFRWNIPENFSGPGMFQLDHVTLSRAFCATIDNCSFETGAPPAWITGDLVNPLTPIHVNVAGFNNGFGFFSADPTDGGYALIHGFDGDGPGTIMATQDVVLPLWADFLRFDYRAGWDMLNFSGSTRPRLFSVEIQPGGGGPAFVSDVVLVAPPGTHVNDTGELSRTLPIGAFAGQYVRIAFQWEIPENYTGPGFFQLDHVSVNNSALAAGGPDPRSMELRPVAPNPSRDDATFRFALEKAGDVELEVLDVRGARVWGERRVGLPAGEHALTWNGRRSGGGLAPAGVYYARVHGLKASRTRMFVRAR